MPSHLAGGRVPETQQESPTLLVAAFLSQQCPLGFLTPGLT